MLYQPGGEGETAYEGESNSVQSLDHRVTLLNTVEVLTVIKRVK